MPWPSLCNIKTFSSAVAAMDFYIRQRDARLQSHEFTKVGETRNNAARLGSLGGQCTLQNIEGCTTTIHLIETSLEN